MSRPYAFVPKDFLEVPGYFGQQEDVQWYLATDLLTAMRLARSREQHELSLAIRMLQRRYNNTDADFAQQIGAKDATTTGRKLAGSCPATEQDLILWSWITGLPRRSFRPDDLTEEPIAVPRFPMNRRRER